MTDPSYPRCRGTGVAHSAPYLRDQRVTFQNAHPDKDDDVVLCKFCGEVLHAPEEDVFWKDTSNHECKEQIKSQLAEVLAILDTQAPKVEPDGWAIINNDRVMGYTSVKPEGADDSWHDYKPFWFASPQPTDNTALVESVAFLLNRLSGVEGYSLTNDDARDCPTGKALMQGKETNDAS